MNTLAITLSMVVGSGWLSPTQEVEVTGWAKRHDRVQSVAAYRGLDLSLYEGAAAVMSCGDLGREVWVWTGEGVWVGPLLVVDCAGPEHYQRRVQQGDVVELGKWTWERLGLPLDVVPVTVRFESPLVRKGYRVS